MVIPDSSLLLAVAAVITSLSSLVWAFRRRMYEALLGVGGAGAGSYPAIIPFRIIDSLLVVLAASMTGHHYLRR